MSKIIGSNCCSGCGDSPDGIFFNCNELTDSEGTFSIALDDVFIQTDSHKSSRMKLNHLDSVIIKDVDYIIAVSDNKFSVYEGIISKGIHFTIQVDNIETELTDTTVSYTIIISPVIINQNTLNFDDFINLYEDDLDGSTFNDWEMIYDRKKKEWDYEYKHENYEHKFEKKITFNHSPDELFDLNEEIFNESFTSNGVEINLELGFADGGGVSNYYNPETDEFETIHLEFSEKIIYVREWKVKHPEKLFEVLAYKPFLYGKEEPGYVEEENKIVSSNFRFAVGIFGGYEELGDSQLEMRSINRSILLANNNKSPLDLRVLEVTKKTESDS